MMRWALALMVLGAFAAQSAHARVFNFKQSGFAGYFRGTGGLQGSGAQAYEGSSGATTKSFSRDVDYNFSGELGFLWSAEKVSVRAGLEALQTRDVEATGKDASDAALMNVKSRALAFNPNITFEYNLTNTGTFKTMLFAGVGYSTLKVSNEYTLTAAGQAAYAGVPDYKEVVSGFALSSQFGGGVEFLMFDNVTLLTELGYRYLQVSNLKYEDSLTTVNGAVSSGDYAKDNLGHRRAFDFGGFFVGLSFRFYIPQFM